MEFFLLFLMVALMAPLALKEQRYRKRETEALVAIEREMERNLAALREAAEHRFRRNYDVARTGCALADTPLFIVAHVEAAYADDICDERALLEALKALGECLDKRAPARKQKRPADGPGASVSGTADA